MTLFNVSLKIPPELPTDATRLSTTTQSTHARYADASQPCKTIVFWFNSFQLVAPFAILGNSMIHTRPKQPDASVTLD